MEGVLGVESREDFLFCFLICKLVQLHRLVCVLMGQSRRE